MTFGIASQQQLLRMLLSDYLVREKGARMVAAFASCTDLQKNAHSLRNADVLLVDGDLPGGDPMSTIQALLDSRMTRKVLLLSSVPGAYFAHQAFQLGLKGVVHKNDTPEIIHQALVTVLAGGLFFSPNVAVLERAQFSAVLSVREIDVLKELAAGTKPAIAAARLKMARATVLTHRRNLFRKLELTSQTELVFFALRNGLIGRDRSEIPLPRQR